MLVTSRTALIFASLTLVGCAAELREPERFSNVDSCGNVEELLENECGGAGCHASETPAAALDLVSAGVFGRLVDEVGTDNCGNALLVDSGNISGSLLLDKLSAQPSCGAQMPLGRPALSQTEVDCIESYLEDER